MKEKEKQNRSKSESECNEGEGEWRGEGGGGDGDGEEECEAREKGIDENTCAWKHYLASRSASSLLAWTTPAYETNRQQNGVPAWANMS